LFNGLKFNGLQFNGSQDDQASHFVREIDAQILRRCCKPWTATTVLRLKRR